MKHSKVLWIVLSLALFCVLQMGCQPKQIPAPPQVPAGEQTQVPGGELAEIRGTFIDGTTFNPADYAGKVVILDFWATWCGPCRREIAETVIPMYAKYHADGLEIIGISSDENAQTVQAFVPQNGITWKQMLKEAATTSDGTMLSKRYEVHYIPFTVLLGRDGQIVNMGLRGSELERAVAQEISKGK